MSSLVPDQAFQPREHYQLPHAPIIALAASAGGLHTLIVLLSCLPQPFPAPILIAQHLSPSFHSQMARILTERAAFPVCWAEEGELPHAGRAYMTPPGRHLTVCSDGTLSLPRAQKIGLGRPSADRLFQSLAQRPWRQTVAAVLSGLGRDGSRGICALKEAGGVTIAQDIESSNFPDMPRSAAATGCIDFVLPLAEIGSKLTELTRQTLVAS